MVEPNYIGGLLGGMLIGLASILLLAGSGRIAGISGILGGLYGKWTDAESQWRIIFLLGLVAGAGLVSVLIDGLAVHMQTHGLPLLIAGAYSGAT